MKNVGSKHHAACPLRNQTTPSRWRWHLGAAALYATASWGILDHGAGLASHVLGIGSDPYLFMWCLAWWPWSLLHHLNPLYTNLAWQPEGIHIAWTTCIPLLALLTAPITLTFGPGVSFNVLQLLAPLISGFAAYMLCLRLSKRPGAALIGGFLYGFSAFQMAINLEELNLSFNYMPPLLALLAIARLQDTITRTYAVSMAALLLASGFYISVETFATTVIFAGVAWLLAYWLLKDRRSSLVRFLPESAMALGLTTILTAPQLVPMLLSQDVAVPRNWPYLFSGHLFYLITPSPAVALAAGPALAPLGRGLFGLIPETDVTTGLPIILILWLCARERWHQPLYRYGLVLLAVILVASLGPRLWWGDVPTNVVMPWQLMLRLPLISSALPVRFAAYSSLLVALLAACWIVRPDNRVHPHRLALGLLACLMLVPPPHPVKPLPLQRFFMPGRMQAFLGAHPRVLILPGQSQDPSPLWQAENDFGFAHTRGFLGVPPKLAARYPAQIDFAFGLQPSATDIRNLCLETRTQYVIAGADTKPSLFAVMQNLGWTQHQVDGFKIYTVPSVSQ